ncbi:MAG: hypothetical protein M3Z21_09955 [Pseudomonadota bacterium]|nr:hypothetical protein [Pseudomonadota bacterium]
MNQEPRDEIKKILVEYYSGKLGKKIEDEYPNKDQEEIQALVHARVEELLQKFEKYQLIKEIKHIIVQDCKEELTKASKREKVIDVCIGLLTTIMAILLVLVSLNKDLPASVQFLTWASFSFCILIIFLHVSLKVSR